MEEVDSACVTNNNEMLPKSPEESEMDVLAAIKTLEIQEKLPHTDPGEADQVNVREEVPVEVTFSEAADGIGWRVMTNPIMMEKISHFLSDKDLVALCMASKTTKNIVDQMDSSCWRKKVQKLEAVLRLDATDSTSTTYKERFIILKSEVDRLANTIKGIMEDDFSSITVFPQDPKSMSLQDLARAASLVHHGILGEVSFENFHLESVNLSSIPTQQLGSLAACVTDEVCIHGDVNIPNLGVLLDKVWCYSLIFTNRTLQTEDTSALIRAMQTRVYKVDVIYEHIVDREFIRALRNYDGKGECAEVMLFVKEMDPNTFRYTEEDLRQCAQAIDWDVQVIHTLFIIRRKQHQEDESDEDIYMF